MKEHIGNMYELSQIDQHVWQVTKRDNTEWRRRFSLRHEARDYCADMNGAYSIGYIDGSADTARELSDIGDKFDALCDDITRTTADRKGVA